MMPRWPERNWRILFVQLNYDASMTRKELTDIICPIKISKCWMPRWFYDLECNSKLWIVTHDIWSWVLKLLWCLHDPKGIDGWRILLVPLKFVNVGRLDDFMILRAILDYQLSPIYDIWAWVLKLLWCLHHPKEIDGYYLCH